MNKQTFKLLEYIIESGNKPLAIDELADIFQVSNRSFYNYYEDIYDFLSAINSQRLVVFNNHEFWFNGNDDDIKLIKNTLSSLSFYEYRLSGEERKNIITILLANSDAPIKSVYFEEMLYVSRNTIISDLKEVKDYIDTFGVQIAENKRNGTYLIADEAKRREIIVTCLRKLDIEKALFTNGICNPCCVFLINHLKINKYLNISEKAITDSENELLVKLPDIHFYQLVLILVIFIERIETSHLINTIYDYDKDDEFSNFIKRIFVNLGDDFKLLENEIGYFITVSKEENIASHIVKSKDNPQYMSILIKDLLFDIQPHYKTNLVDDKTLNDFLIAHINVCYHRTTAKKYYNNPFGDDIRVKYKDDFERLKHSIYILENGLNISLNDDEISYILMHIIASVERNTIPNNPLNVVVVCQAGIATSNLLSALIKKNFNVNIIAAAPIHRLNSILEANHIDLIISTLPIDDQNIPTVTVNAVLSDKDIAKIHNQIVIINSKAHLNSDKKVIDDYDDSKNANITFLDLLSKKMINLDGDATKWQEAIIFAGEILLWNNNITAGYITEMVNLVEKFGPYIVIAPGIAIAHAQPENGTLKPGASIVRFSKPITFGKNEFDPVEVVVACAVFDTHEYVNALLQLMTAIRKPSFLEMMRKAKRPNDVIHFLEGASINIVNKKAIII